MSSRVDKYYDDNVNTSYSRMQRNSNLYKEIGKTDLDNYEVRSNATVIGDNSKGSIDVEKIKSILDTHYKDAPRRKSIQIVETSTLTEIENPVHETKEYDINVIIDKAKENKEEDYNIQRAKKLHNTQYDILSNLDINLKDYVEDYEEPESKSTSNPAKLQELINTITLNEKDIKAKKEIIESGEGDPLDIFEDLKGSDNTAVLDGLQEKTEELVSEIEKTRTTSFDKEFFTKTNAFKKDDFESFEEDVEGKTSWLVKLIIFLLFVVLIGGILILVKQFI